MPSKKFGSLHKFSGKRRKAAKRPANAQISEDGTGLSQNDPTSTENNTNAGADTCNENTTVLSPSEKKIKLFEEPEIDTDTEQIHGFRLVDTLFILNLVAGFNCPHCGDSDSLDIREDTFRGLSSTFRVYCHTCEEIVHSATTSESINEAKGAPAVNRRAVIAMKELGCGKAGLDKLAKVFDFPRSLEKEAFSKHNKLVSKESVKVTADHLDEAAAVVRKAYEDSDPSLKDQDVINICVACDGTWHKRGYTSHYNVTIITDILTGLVLDYEVMCNYCLLCTRNKMDKASQQYNDWYAAHEEHCTINHRGSSKAMESEAAVRLFERSIERHKFRYTTLLNDGDSSVYNEISGMNDGEGPYSESHPVENEDCTNHVSKRMKNGLDKVIQQEKARGTPIDGRGRLTKDRVRAMQNYYGRAIKDHSNNLDGMHQATWAVLFHYIDWEDPEIPKNLDKSVHRQHKHCAAGPESWCWYNRELANGITEPQRGDHSTPLSYKICQAILPVFTRLCDKTLLKRCLRGGTQNVNESLNGKIWERAPKVKCASLSSIQNAAARGVIEFNKGALSLVSLMEYSSITPGSNMVKLCKSRDRDRISHSRYQSTERFRRQRKEKELNALRKQMQQENQEGTSYKPGNF